MKVVILCGGHGMRIRDVADNIPKPLIPIGNLPILWHIMRTYSHAGYNEFVLCLGYKGNAIKDFFLNYEAHTKDFTIASGKKRSIQYHSKRSDSQWRTTLADTGLDAMTGARVKRIQNYIGRDPHFMLTYGDGVSDVNLKNLVRFHLAHKKILTITGVRPPGRFGELMSDAQGRVTEFNEKPQATGGRISGGFFVCRREIFDYLSDEDDSVFETEPMRRLVSDREAMVYSHDGFWHPMDTQRDYAALNALWAQKKAPWKLWS